MVIDADDVDELAQLALGAHRLLAAAVDDERHARYVVAVGAADGEAVEVEAASGASNRVGFDTGCC